MAASDRDPKESTNPQDAERIPDKGSGLGAGGWGLGGIQRAERNKAKHFKFPLEVAEFDSVMQVTPPTGHLNPG